jgi:hypothetical protein
VQTAINCYLEQIEGLGETRTLTQVSAPGLALYLSLGAEIRGQRNVEGRWFVVAGGTLYEIVGGAAVSRGTLSSAERLRRHVPQQHAAGDRGRPEGCTCSPGHQRCSHRSSSGWRGSKTVGFIDGYSIFVAPDTDQFYLSAIDDSSTMDALDFSSADAQPDNVVTLLVLHRELLLFGLYTTEVWINSGGALFPFMRYNSAQIDVGLCRPERLPSLPLTPCSGSARRAPEAASSTGCSGTRRSGCRPGDRADAGQVDRPRRRRCGPTRWTATSSSASTRRAEHHAGVRRCDAAVARARRVGSGWAPLRVTSVCYVNGGAVRRRRAGQPVQDRPVLSTPTARTRWCASAPGRTWSRPAWSRSRSEPRAGLHDRLRRQRDAGDLQRRRQHLRPKLDALAGRDRAVDAEGALDDAGHGERPRFPHPLLGRGAVQHHAAAVVFLMQEPENNDVFWPIRNS